MTITYTEKTNDIGWKYIEILDSDKPDSIGIIPIDPANSDYQTYLSTLASESGDKPTD